MKSRSIDALRLVLAVWLIVLLLPLLPRAVSALLLALNLATGLAYLRDKLNAANGGARLPERLLHLLALFGGCVGACAGQLLFNHKTRKLSFALSNALGLAGYGFAVTALS